MRIIDSVWLVINKTNWKDSFVDSTSVWKLRCVIFSWIWWRCGVAREVDTTSRFLTKLTVHERILQNHYLLPFPQTIPQFSFKRNLPFNQITSILFKRFTEILISVIIIMCNNGTTDLLSVLCFCHHHRLTDYLTWHPFLRLWLLVNYNLIRN